MDNRPHAIRAVLAIFVTLVAIPMTMHATLTLQGGQTIQERAQEDRVDARARIRKYWKAMEIYRGLREAGAEGLERPSLNDPASIERYIQERSYNTIVSEHAAAAEDESVADRYNALPEKHRDLLDGYAQMGWCPSSLMRHYVDGFYELCKDYTEQRKQNLLEERLERSQLLRGFTPVKEHRRIGDRVREFGEGVDRSEIHSGDHRPHLKRVPRR